MPSLNWADLVDPLSHATASFHSARGGLSIPGLPFDFIQPDAGARFRSASISFSYARTRKVAFNVLISNTDDHLRNHGFIYLGDGGWRLSPAYDMNPVPIELKARELCTYIEFNNSEASLELAFEVAEYFGVKAADAREIAQKIAQDVSNWRATATSLGIRPREIERMQSAFEHTDLKLALNPKQTVAVKPI